MSLLNLQICNYTFAGRILELGTAIKMEPQNLVSWYDDRHGQAGEKEGWEGVWRGMKNAMWKDRRYSRSFEDDTYAVVEVVYSTPKDTT